MTITVVEIGPDTFEVTVNDGKGETRHTVTLPDTLLRALTERLVSKPDLVKASFRFLLDREPKESILRKFNVSAIEMYFPEFRRELNGYLDKKEG